VEFRPGLTTEQLLAPLSPDEGALAALFRANFDEDTLREIADADDDLRLIGELVAGI
jgi:hypothetical protein